MTDLLDSHKCRGMAGVVLSGLLSCDHASPDRPEDLAWLAGVLARERGLGYAAGHSAGRIDSLEQRHPLATSPRPEAV